jgi:hypothetical protein
MKAELTTPKAILIGMSLIAVAIASIPYSKSVVTEAHAASGVQKVQICGLWHIDNKLYCAGVTNGGILYTKLMK